MPDYDLGQIAEIIEEKHYRPGQMIIEEHTEAERFFIISTGKIEISKRFEDGEQFALAVHSDGEFFGEMALLDEGRRSASARALEDTTVLEISRPNFETLLYKAPVLAYSIMKELSSRLRETGALLVSHLQRKNRQLTRAYLDTLTLLMKSVEDREASVIRHARRVRSLAEALGRRLSLNEGELFLLEIRALLHEIASGELPESIASRDNPLTADILAVADRFETLTSPARSDRIDRDEALRRVKGDRKLNRRVVQALEELDRAGELPRPE
ncbi:MAG: cyclic nucleotide-binding domain-containing protein [Spirochaetales bacterium]|nr:cyclic nucleotide-binding domain-containing protein [Spirochaetales bacterium]